MQGGHGAGQAVSRGVRPAVAGMQGCYCPVGCCARPDGRGSEAGGQAPGSSPAREARRPPAAGSGPAKPASARRAARRGGAGQQP